MKFRIDVSDDEFGLFERFAQSRWQSVPEMVHEVVVERIVDTHDLRAYEETLEAHRRNAFVFSLDEVKQELGIL